MGSVTTVTAPAAARRSLWWRVHWWAALIASPFLLLALGTGLLYVFTPQIEGALYRHLDQVQPSGQRADLDAIVAAALRTVPTDTSVVSVMPGGSELSSTRVVVRLPAAGAADAGTQTIYVDPYRVRVLGQMADAARFNQWARKLHSSLLQGDGWRWMIELCASWLLVMLLTGVVLWWPDGKGQIIPRSQVRGRRFWRQWHAFVGVTLMLLTAAMVLTGITWSRHAGAEVRALRDAIGQGPVRLPTLHSSMGAGEALTWQRAWQLGQQYTQQRDLQLIAPATPDGVWKLSLADRRQPLAQFTLVLDAYSGDVLQRLNWRDQPWFVQATAVGIPFHRGELGVWNQVLLAVFAAGIGFSLVSGWVMYFQRPRSQWLGLPALLPGAVHSLRWPAWCWLVLLLALLPLLRISAPLVLLLEWWARRHTAHAAQT